MMSEDHPLVGNEKITTVFEALGGSGAESIEGKNLRCNELAVEAVPEGIARRGRHHEPERINRFTAMNRDHSDRDCAKNCDSDPREDRKSLVHAVEHCGEFYA